MSLENNNSVLEESTPSVPATEETVTPVTDSVEEVPVTEFAAETAAEEVASVVEDPVVKPAPAEPAKKGKKKHKKPHIAVRIPLQLLSLVLCVALLGAVVITAVLGDLRQVQSKDGIKQIITAFFDRPNMVRPVYGAVGMHMNAADVATSTDNDAMVDWLMEQIESQYGEDLPVDREAVENFLEESTITDFVADKFASYTEDFISGEDTTSITTEEVKQLIEENKDLIQDTFGVEITDEITDTITDYVEEVDIDKVIKEEVFESVGDTSVGIPVPEIPNMGGFLPGVDSVLPDTEEGTAGELTVNDMLALLREITSDQVMYSAVGICAGIALLLLLCNFYSIPGGLGWISAPVILAGLILSAPVYFFLGNQETLTMLLGDQAMVANAVIGVLTAIAPVHYTVLGIGAGTAVLSIIIRIIRAVIRKKKYA